MAATCDDGGAAPDGAAADDAAADDATGAGCWATTGAGAGAVLEVPGAGVGCGRNGSLSVDRAGIG